MEGIMPKFKTRRQRLPPDWRNPDACFEALVATNHDNMTPAQRNFASELVALHQYAPRGDGRLIMKITKMARDLSLACKGCPAACCHKHGTLCYFLDSNNRCSIYTQRPLVCRLYFCPQFPTEFLRAEATKHGLGIFRLIDDVATGSRWNPLEEEN
jgi:hypothetical protein